MCAPGWCAHSACLGEWCVAKAAAFSLPMALRGVTRAFSCCRSPTAGGPACALHCLPRSRALIVLSLAHGGWRMTLSRSRAPCRRVSAFTRVYRRALIVLSLVRSPAHCPSHLVLVLAASMPPHSSLLGSWRVCYRAPIVLSRVHRVWRVTLGSRARIVAHSCAPCRRVLTRACTVARSFCYRSSMVHSWRGLSRCAPFAAPLCACCW